MIVVAIIGILAAIALPAYQDYTVKSQAGSALSEVTSIKSAFEIVVNEGKTPSTDAAESGYIGQTEDGGTYCKIEVTGTTAVCTTKGGNATVFNDETITLTRDADTGVWSCATSLEAKFKPGNCA
jgi:type IV pilus assembly protein PilA